MNRDERAALVEMLATLGIGAMLAVAVAQWLGWRFVAGLLVGVLADTALYGLVLVRERWRRP